MIPGPARDSEPRPPPTGIRDLLLVKLTRNFLRHITIETLACVHDHDVLICPASLSAAEVQESST
jgi:hypothetical protein